MNKRLVHPWAGILLACAVLTSAWSQPMQTRKATELRQEPASDASVLAQVDMQTPVTRLQGRQGAYVQVRTDQGESGWVRMFDIGAKEGASPDSGAGAAKDALRGLTSLFGAGSRKSDNTETATLGIRGLGAQEIANAQPNPGELKRAQAHQASADQAQAFAAKAGLCSRSVAELPAPTVAPTPTRTP